MNKTTKFIAFIGLFSLIALAMACGGAGTATGGDMKKVMDKKVNDKITVTLYTLSDTDGKMKNGVQEIVLEFTDGKGSPVKINAASLNFNMPAMGTMPEMNDAANLKTTNTLGKFKGNVNLQMGGDWIAQIKYEGEQNGQTNMKLSAKE